MARKPCEKNERIKRKFLEWRKHAGRLSEASLDKEAAAINRFDDWSGNKDFAKFHIEQAKGFWRMLEGETNARTGEPLSAGTRRAILAPLRGFFIWLSQEQGYRSKLRPADAEYFSLSRHDEEIARSAEPRPIPTPEQARHALSLMPSALGIEKRDKALFALGILTAARISALISLRIRHLDMQRKVLSQPGKDVRTKYRKTIPTFLMPGFDEAEAALTDWLTFQRKTLLRGDADPLFPSTEMGIGENGGFQAVGLSRDCWSNAGSARKIIKAAWERANLPNFDPHTFRHMHVTAAMQAGASVEQIMAIGKNLGHENIATTLGSYGGLSEDRRRLLIRGAG